VNVFEVKLHPEVVKFIKKLDPKTRKRVKDALRLLAKDPWRRSPGADIKKLSGTHGRQDLYRLRVGDYRFVYAVEGNAVWVTGAFSRGKGYRI